MNNDKMEHIIFGLQCENNELKLKNIMLEAELNKLKETYTCDYRRNSWKSKFFKAQEEIERLNGKYRNLEINYNAVWEDFRKYEIENAELQKQVDELTDKLGKVLLGIKTDEVLVAKGVEQAVKDTAKEILQMLYDDRNGYWDSCDCGKDETYWRDNSIQGTLNEIKERYGVEVE